MFEVQRRVAADAMTTTIMPGGNLWTGASWHRKQSIADGYAHVAVHR